MNLGLVLGEGFILRHLVGGLAVVGQGVPRHGEEVGGCGGDAGCCGVQWWRCCSGVVAVIAE